MLTKRDSNDLESGQSNLPIVDFTPLTEGKSNDAYKQVAQDLLVKGRVNGFVGIKGTGISPALLKEAFHTVETLFALPLEDKMKVPHADGWVPYRGYSGIGREQGAAMLALKEKDLEKKAELEAIKDYKVNMKGGLVCTVADTSVVYRTLSRLVSKQNQVQHNIWLPESVLPGFRSSALKLYWTLHELARLVLDTLITSLEVSEDESSAIRALYNGHDNSLRLAHYPPRPVEEADRLFSRQGPHTDCR